MKINEYTTAAGVPTAFFIYPCRGEALPAGGISCVAPTPHGINRHPSPTQCSLYCAFHSLRPTFPSISCPFAPLFSNSCHCKRSDKVPEAKRSGKQSLFLPSPEAKRNTRRVQDEAEFSHISTHPSYLITRKGEACCIQHASPLHHAGRFDIIHPLNAPFNAFLVPITPLFRPYHAQSPHFSSKQ